MKEGKRKARWANTGIDTEQAGTPPSSQSSPQNDPAFYSRHQDLSEDEQETSQPQSAPREGGYDGRIQQILYENPELEILIVDASKSPDGNFIAYRIRTGVCKFESKRNRRC